MLRNIFCRLGRNLVARDALSCPINIARPCTSPTVAPKRGFMSLYGGLTNQSSMADTIQPTILLKPAINLTLDREFHAAGSKTRYLDFRYRIKTCWMRSHLLTIRRQKMKKHQRRKFRKRFKCLLAKRRLKREIAKEKAFRVELLTIIRRAEEFDPKEYALKKIAEFNNRPKELTPSERFEQLKELCRVNRYQTDYIKPKHRRAEHLDDY